MTLSPPRSGYKSDTYMAEVWFRPKNSSFRECFEQQSSENAMFAIVLLH